MNVLYKPEIGQPVIQLQPEKLGMMFASRSVEKTENVE